MVEMEQTEDKLVTERAHVGVCVCLQEAEATD